MGAFSSVVLPNCIELQYNLFSYLSILFTSIDSSFKRTHAHTHTHTSHANSSSTLRRSTACNDRRRKIDGSMQHSNYKPKWKECTTKLFNVVLASFLQFDIFDISICISKRGMADSFWLPTRSCCRFTRFPQIRGTCSLRPTELQDHMHMQVVID